MDRLYSLNTNTSVTTWGRYVFISINALLYISFIFMMSNAVAQTPAHELKVSAPTAINKSGRLYIVFNQDDTDEPRFYSAWPTQGVEPMFATDLQQLDNTIVNVADEVLGFEHALSDLPAGTYSVQALYDTDFLDGRMNSPLNYFSKVQSIVVNAGEPIQLAFELTEQIPAETLPEDTEHLRFVKMKSDLVSAHWQQDMHIRAAVLLPAQYSANPLKKFPVFYSVGGYHSKYTRALSLMENDAFKEYWFADDTPQMVIVFLDSQAPFGDSYQMDSANNGPYGEATINELIPFLEQKFNLYPQMEGRFVSGCSTGGWVSLAMQLYYPDTFNGAWSFSADGVDFRYFQLVDIYEDENAYVNEHGSQRPSYRAKDGEIIFSIKHEIMMENVMGKHNSFAYSGGQWGGWNAVYGPRNADGSPSTIWDPVTGKIDKEVAEQWQKFDLRKYTEDNWQTLGPKLQGKLHIWMGDMDNFYLNNAMYLYEEMLNARQEPVSDAEFTWKRGVGHCDYNQVDMLQSTISKMHKRYESTRPE
ncbi:esterase [Glaciecola sp. XM2]|uniref:alpha/beta hydrolase-fold protein n=1 Tax=Glaciecola sp. XM2 TaxID=1914931 RepID=UPI001BDE4227|nr:alpha/beta hydrolase-fold protein [Glaciecola sp. XM2]MBT1450396.1 esterase [Glaciecola sp. XM2]